jgi:hypothetical protein
MTARIARFSDMSTPASAPSFEIRMVRHGPADTEVEVWQLPSAVSPQVAAPLRLAGLRGRNLDLIEHRVLKLLRQAGVRFAPLSERKEAHTIGEADALRLRLLFRTLAPMRSRDNVRAVAEGIETMGGKKPATGSAWRCTARTRAGY